MSIDWDAILADDDGGGFEPLPNGNYPVRVIEKEVTKASTGSSMIKVTTSVTEGPYENRRLWSNLVFKTDSPPAMRMLLQKLHGLGVTRDWIASNSPDIEDIARAIDGVEAIAVVEQREYPQGSGEIRNDIKIFRPIAGSGSPAPKTGGSEIPPAPSLPRCLRVRCAPAR